MCVMLTMNSSGINLRMVVAISVDVNFLWMVAMYPHWIELIMISGTHSVTPSHVVLDVTLINPTVMSA